MEYLGADKNTLSFFSLTCDSYKFSPHVHPDEATAVTIPCQENRRRNTITCKNKNLDEFILDVGSLDMNTVNLKGANFHLEEKIPVITKEFFNLSANKIQNGIIAVRLTDIFLQKPIRQYYGAYKVSRALKFDQNILQKPVFKGKKVILLFSGQDVLLEHLWWDRKNLKLFDSISEIGFTAVTTPNFSVFKGECPVGQALNIKKGLECGAELEKIGVTVIPHVYAVHQAQAERWSNWLNKHPGIKIITMNCQLQRRSRAGKDITVSFLNYLFSKTDVSIILHGADKEILGKIKSFKGRVHVADSGIFKRIEITKPAIYQALICSNK